MSTTDVLKVLMPKLLNPDAWAKEFDLAFEWFFIEDDADKAAFFAQVAHESAELSRLEENLIYSAERLMEVWPARFPTLAVAQQYARAPHKLADYVYANRMGNGDAASGDGWRFRGRGPIQLTGRDNYLAFSKAIAEPAVILAPDMVLTRHFGALAASWFWSKNKLSLLAVDQPGDDIGKDFETITRRINGGSHGQAARARYWAIARRAYGLTEV